MSAATFTREAIVGTAPRVAPAPRVAQRPTAAGSARACVVARPAANAQGLSDHGLMAIMVSIALVFLFGAVVLVQGFWAVSQTPSSTTQESVIITTR